MKSVYSAPGMYNSEYTNIGRGRPVPSDWFEYFENLKTLLLSI
jgi:hypothetical protein